MYGHTTFGLSKLYGPKGLLSLNCAPLDLQLCSSAELKISPDNVLSGERNTMDGWGPMLATMKLHKLTKG
jgi:hypothetical protein